MRTKSRELSSEIQNFPTQGGSAPWTLASGLASWNPRHRSTIWGPPFQRLDPPLPYTPTHTLHTFISINMSLNTVLFNQYTSHGVFWKFGSLWWRDGGNGGAPWWRNDNWDPLIPWWEIRGHHFDDMMRKLGALDGAMENLGPFAL